MNPIIHNELMKARVADLHHQAGRDRLARAAATDRRARAEHGWLLVASHAATVLARRIVTIVGARSLRPTRGQARWHRAASPQHQDTS